MPELVFEANDITKVYGEKKALNRVSMKIKRGEIYGFIGENGAGKTTMIRLLAGLAEPTGGELHLFGKSGKELYPQRARIGYIIENPSLYLNMNARENLEIQKIQKGTPNTSSEHILHLVGLDFADKTKVKNYSLGMKQRLALAIAILGEPEFLVLDEPINGLDPMGIVEIRNLLKKLNGEGITILITSHILAELHQVATSYGILHNGNMLKELSNEELDHACGQSLLLQVDDVQKTKDFIVNKLHTHRFELLPDGKIKIFDRKEQNVGEIASMLHNTGINVFNIELQNTNLESYYIELVEKGER